LPSNTFTFLNSVAPGCFASIFAAGGATGAGCAGPSGTCSGCGPRDRIGVAREPTSPAAASTSTIRVGELHISRPPSQVRHSRLRRRTQDYLDRPIIPEHTAFAI